MKPLTYIWAILLMTATGCTEELDIALPISAPQLVLNGLLHPDSIIQISLTTTLPSSTTAGGYPLIDDAEVILYEDEQFIGELALVDSVYTLDYYPKPGHEYRLEITAPGYATVQASDVVPDPPNAEVCFQEDTIRRYAFSDGILQIEIKDPEQEENF